MNLLPVSFSIIFLKAAKIVFEAKKLYKFFFNQSA